MQQWERMGLGDSQDWVQILRLLVIESPQDQGSHLCGGKPWYWLTWLLGGPYILALTILSFSLLQEDQLQTTNMWLTYLLNNFKEPSSLLLSKDYCQYSLTKECKALWQHLVFLVPTIITHTGLLMDFYQGKEFEDLQSHLEISPVHPNFCIIHIMYSSSIQWGSAMCRMSQLRGPLLCKPFLGCSFPSFPCNWDII